jgi:cytidylate kinase
MTSSPKPRIDGLKPLLVTIDGPAGAGKTTVSRCLARRLGYRCIDTGALYRGIALMALEQGIGPDDPGALAAMCQALRLAVACHGEGFGLLINGRDVTGLIRTPQVAMMASAVSAQPPVRAYLLTVQHQLGRTKNAVFEGRDMGTVVFPDADIKFFLDADPAVRARRRHAEMPAGASMDRVADQIAQRDSADSSRALAPLQPAADAQLIDATDLSIDEVVDRMIDGICRRFLPLPAGCTTPAWENAKI